MTIKDILHFRACMASDAIRSIKDAHLSNGGHISPSSVKWTSYQFQKREASLYFSCLNILKGRPPQHGHDRHARLLVAKLRRQLERRPERFVLVASWLEKKEACRVHAR